MLYTAAQLRQMSRRARRHLESWVKLKRKPAERLLEDIAEAALRAAEAGETGIVLDVSNISRKSLEIIETTLTSPSFGFVVEDRVCENGLIVKWE